MPGIERYEILVIGSGEAGKHLTWNTAQAGTARLLWSGNTLADRVLTLRAYPART
jgi:pyruvate/2-oxoglutarate dehydrogenase complex dihydrolipoamide dehydrogenase (E3) component